MMLSKLHRRSWFATEGVSGCEQTFSGSLAGNSLGDYVFLLAFSRVLSAVEDALERAGVLFHVKSDILEPTFGVDPKSKDIPDTVPLDQQGMLMMPFSR